MLEEFFVPPAYELTKWAHRAVSASFHLFPSQSRRAWLRKLLDGPAGLRWVEQYASETIDFSHPKYAFIEDAIQGAEQVQWIGCCSGREAAYFAQRYPKIEFHASDLSHVIVQWCRAYYRLPNLRFDVRDVTTDPLGGDLVVSLGVLTYLDAGQILQFAERQPRLCAAEPVSAGFDRTGPTTYRGRMAWNHPYQRLFHCRRYAEIPSDGAVSVLVTV